MFFVIPAHPQSLHLHSPVHVSLNKPSSIQCTARQSRPPVKILIAINGHMINDDSKYKTDIIQIPMQREYDASSDDALLNQQQITYVPSISSISAEDMRQSYYDTITNVTIDDITMKMQGQTVECFAYSFVNEESYLNFNSQTRKNHYHHLVGSLNKITNAQQNNIMSTKSIMQVDCKCMRFILLFKDISKILKTYIRLQCRCARS